MKIKNLNILAISDGRKVALDIAEAGLNAIDTKVVVDKAVRIKGSNLFIQDSEFFLNDAGRIFVVGMGKCAADGALALEKILGGHLSGGIIIDVKEAGPLQKIKAYQGTHPLPSDSNIAAAKEITKLLGQVQENDFIIFLVSGGGSTLLCLPEEKGCIEEKSMLQVLMNKGASIQEINVVRKHLSLARGGYLAKYAFPARSVSLIFSDVPTNDIQFIASGPTVKDVTTIEDAGKVLEKYDVLRMCGIKDCGLIETPKEDKYFEKTSAVIVASNRTALDAMQLKAVELGFRAEICTECLTGEARAAGKEIVEKLSQTIPKTALLYGGETTVKLRSGGKGGRNLELALSGLQAIKENELLLSLASDGRDNTDFAGAICDIITKKKAAEMGLDDGEFLRGNDSYHFFEKTRDYLLTGKTGSNVSDLVAAIKL